MTEFALKLKGEILQLSEDDREELARVLWDSLSARGSEIDEDDRAWIAELDRRAEDLAAGRATAEPFRQAIEELRQEGVREQRSR